LGSIVDRARAAYQQQVRQQPRCSTTPTLPPLVTAAELFGDQLTPAPPQEPPLRQRLERLFGTGQDPARRRALYARLEALAKGKDGDLVLTLISTARMQAMAARDRGKYFSAAICGMLRDHNLAASQPGKGGAP
jgi:hypothetical protein